MFAAKYSNGELVHYTEWKYSGTRVTFTYVSGLERTVIFANAEDAQRTAAIASTDNSVQHVIVDSAPQVTSHVRLDGLNDEPLLDMDQVLR